MSARTALLLVGSAKQPHSTSERLAEHLAARLRTLGVDTECLAIYRTISSEARQEALLAKIDAADLVVLAFPLFVDTLPYIVTRTLEQVAARRIETAGGRRQALAAIVNCGFPEAHQNDVAIGICRQFARETGFRWAGGLGLGGGETINGKPLGECGGLVRNVVAALNLAAGSLAAGEDIPPQAVAWMARPLVPIIVYRLFGEISWRLRAHRHGVRKRLKARPYAP